MMNLYQNEHRVINRAIDPRRVGISGAMHYATKTAPEMLQC